MTNIEKSDSIRENPNRVFNVGALGIDSIRKIDLLSKDQLIKIIK